MSNMQQVFPQSPNVTSIDGGFTNMVKMAGWEFFAIAQIFLLI
ncbi:hypothetical protein [Nostoc sp. DedQUE04]|nr:hypothetical protein [Nostoc sp. DedQUE04]